MTKHPYYVTAKDEQREAFIAEVRAIMARREETARPVGRRVLPVLQLAA